MLTSVNKDPLLNRIRGKSQREVDAIVAEYEPRALPPDRVRPVVVRVPVVVSAIACGDSAAESASGARRSIAVDGCQHSAPTEEPRAR